MKSVTVEELIKMLSKYPKEAEVTYMTYEGQHESISVIHKIDGRNGVYYVLE